jgi:hypothetical protein
MIKKVFFTAALLVPGLAYAGNPSNLSMQIVPAESDPAVPAEAAAAGFTTLAADYDFSKPLYATLSNWLDCGSNPSLPWHWQNNSSIACNSTNISQVNDGGSNVVALTFPVGSTQPGALVIATINNTATAAVDFGNAYYETIVRYDVGSGNTLHSLQANWMWPTNTQYDQRNPPFTCCAGALEMDLIEMAAPPDLSDQAYHYWDNSGGGFVWQGRPLHGFASNLDPTVYHKFGILKTSNGTNDIRVCSWLDDIFQSCDSPPANSDYLVNRNFLEMWVQIQNANPTEIVNTPFSSYTQYFRAWSCANWNNGSQGSIPYSNATAAAQCNGSTLFNSGGLTYWH